MLKLDANKFHRVAQQILLCSWMINIACNYFSSVIYLVLKSSSVYFHLLTELCCRQIGVLLKGFSTNLSMGLTKQTSAQNILTSAVTTQKQSISLSNTMNIISVFQSLQPRSGAFFGSGVSLQHPLYDEGAAQLPLLLPPRAQVSDCQRYIHSC